MADKRIDELDAISSLSDDSLFVAEQSGSAGKVTGLQFKNFAKEAAAAYAESAANSATAASESASAASSAASSATAAQSAIENMTVSSETLGAGAAATVTKTETAGVVNLEFGLPQGRTATVAVGTVTTGAAGTEASVTNSGTDTDAVLDFVLPRGADGQGAGDMTASVYDPAGGKKQVAFASDLTAHTGNNTIHVTASEKESWSGKQDELTFDSAPTSGSTNPVTSGGVHTALSSKANASALSSHTGNSTIHITGAERTKWNAKQDALTFDSTPKSGSSNPVTSGGVYTALSKKEASGTATSLINRSTAVNAADTNYSTYMARGEALFSTDTTPSVNGAIAWTYG